MRLWVLFHGSPAEDVPEAYECRRLIETAKEQGIELDVIDPDKVDISVKEGGAWTALYEGQPLLCPDLIIPRTGSDTTYTAQAVMRFFEGHGVAFLNRPHVVDMVADKLHTLQVLAAGGASVPRTVLGRLPADAEQIEELIGFPVVMKTLRGTRGSGTALIPDKQTFVDFMEVIAKTSGNPPLIFQEYIKSSHGRDIRVFVVDGRVVACMQRHSVDGSFKSNISRGGQGEPLPVTKEVADLALRVTALLGLDVAGIDILFDEGGFVICEANSSPGFEGLEASCGIDAASSIIDAAVRKVNAGRRGGILLQMAHRFRKTFGNLGSPGGIAA